MKCNTNFFRYFYTVLSNNIFIKKNTASINNNKISSLIKISPFIITNINTQLYYTKKLDLSQF